MVLLTEGPLFRSPLYIEKSAIETAKSVFNNSPIRNMQTSTKVKCASMVKKVRI
jgi:hypothetical protein